MDRRTLILGAISVPIAVSRASADGPRPFNADTVTEAAKVLANKPFQSQDITLPEALSKLTYDQYRLLRFNHAKALWHGTKIPYHVEFYHRGFIFPGRVEINQIDGGTTSPVLYQEDMFDSNLPLADADYGFAGFRINAPLNRPNHFDEVSSFLGASYFRAVAKGLTYGLSARGLAIKTGNPAGEEFPYFKTFWIERPTHSGPVTVHALLDSQSCTAAVHFVISPGADTVFETRITVFPRVTINEIGVAPLTSMFFFDTNDRTRAVDWRPAVHDSDGLLMLSGNGVTLWRALANPTSLQISNFEDISPRGFGLMQRKRKLDDYQDLEASYDTRPSCWVEPLGKWGAGNIVLTEIPTDAETRDNIVAFWRPKQALEAGRTYEFSYKLHWAARAPVKTPAPFIATMVGVTGKFHIFVLNIGELSSDLKPQLDVTADKGKLSKVNMQPDPKQGGWRISFELDPGDEKVIELRARLMMGEAPLTETWMYRWTG